MNTKKKPYIGQVLKSKGCYTNFGMVMHTTNKVNATTLAQVDSESAVRAVIDSDNKKVGKMNATYAPQLTCPTSCPFYPEIYGDILDIEERMLIGLQLAEIEARKIDELPG